MGQFKILSLMLILLLLIDSHILSAQSLENQNKNLIEMFQWLKQIKPKIKDQTFDPIKDQKAFKLHLVLEKLADFTDQYLHQLPKSSEILKSRKKLWIEINQGDQALLLFKHDLWCIDPIFYDYLLKHPTKNPVKSTQIKEWQVLREMCQE